MNPFEKQNSLSEEQLEQREKLEGLSVRITPLIQMLQQEPASETTEVLEIIANFKKENPDIPGEQVNAFARSLYEEEMDLAA